MLHLFLQDHKLEILALVEKKSVQLAGSRSSSEELKRGLPIFFDHLVQYLKHPAIEASEKEIVACSSEHGRELMRLNYTLSHVVHSYGAVCQAITEFAQKENAHITTQNFNDLNLCLDIAIAAAVSEFQFYSVRKSEEKEVQHLGVLVHELRNALSAATIAHDMIRRGLVGTGGSTARVLGDNLLRMRQLIDRSLSEVRMRADPDLYIEKFQLLGMVDQILLTTTQEATLKQQTVRSEIEGNLKIETDRQLLLSAISNLIQNAIKYTKVGGTITVRAKLANLNLIIEIEDECGGIKPEIITNLFNPFFSGEYDESGLGLGLTIVKRAVSLLEGKVSVVNHPGVGCAFQIEIAQKLIPIPPNRAVSGKKSVQPKLRSQN